ncbi:hypothetical protein C0J52_14898 [Blattella germanica]|nr:hypothetical protein C0J52_14898 [Blattella germanica]
MDPNSRLSSLAIEAFGDYVCRLCLYYVELHERNVGNSSYRTTFKHLKELLCAAVPPSLVNEVTFKLLRRLDGLHETLHNSLKFPWCIEIINEIVKSILHPSVTQLNFAPDYWHEWPYAFDWNFIPLFVYQHIGVLSKLKQIRLSELMLMFWDDIDLGSVAIPPCLEEFTFMLCCTDTVLERIAHSCPELKRLNIFESTNVSDASIDSILKLRYLVQLNVENTSISEKGIARLLRGLTQNQVSENSYSWSCASQLLRFGYSEATSSHLHTLVKNFCNLVSLNLDCDRNCNVLTLKKLENLKVLRLSCVEFPRIEKLLITLGRQLESLEICDVGPINARIIGETCSSLKCLHITSSDTSSIPAAEDFMSPVPDAMNTLL